MQLGTYNKQLSVIIKDKIKEVLFFFKKKNKIKTRTKLIELVSKW